LPKARSSGVTLSHFSAPFFLSRRPFHTPPRPSRASSAASDFPHVLPMASLTIPWMSSPTEPHTHTHTHIPMTKGEAQCRVRAMEGKEKALKTRQGMGCWGTNMSCQHSGRQGGRNPKLVLGLAKGSAWDQVFSLLLGFLLLDTPRARVRPRVTASPSSACPSAHHQERTLGSPTPKPNMSTARPSSTPELQTQQL